MTGEQKKPNAYPCDERAARELLQNGGEDFVIHFTRDRPASACLPDARTVEAHAAAAPGSGRTQL